MAGALLDGISDAGSVGNYPIAELVATRLPMHWALQVVATAGFTFVDAREDFSHTVQSWDRDRRRFIGAKSSDPPTFRAVLDPVEAVLALEDVEGAELDRFALPAHTLDEAYAWLANAAGRLIGEVDPAPTLTRPPHDMPRHSVGKGEAFSAWDRDAGKELAGWFALADATLERVTNKVAGATQRSIWPHHFDLATLVRVADGKSVGVGFSPGDGSYQEPYFYVNPWPYPAPDAELEALPSGARWHRESWTGAVLTASALLKHNDRVSALEAYLQVAIEGARNVLR